MPTNELSPTPTGPADIRDRHRLAKLEETIEHGLATFIEVGTALIEVRDSKLYLSTYNDFEAYLKGRWHMSRPRGYQLMEAATTVKSIEAVSTNVDIPNEAQARALAPIVREYGSKVAADVLAKAGANRPATAASIRAVTAEVTPPGGGSTSSIEPRSPDPSVRLIEAFNAAWTLKDSVDTKTLSDLQYEGLRLAAGRAHKVSRRFLLRRVDQRKLDDLAPHSGQG